MTNTTGWLGRLETLGNKLPHPTLLFVWLCLLLLPLTAVLGALELSTQHPLSEETVTARSLVDGDGIRYLFTSLVGNFTGFAPLGIVLVAMLGLGVAEQSGLLSVSLASLVRRASGRTLVITVAFAGVLSSLTVDAGYVVLIPLAGLVFQLAGRSPIAGIATAFAAVSGGFSANLLVGPVDATLAGLSTEAARIVDPTRTVDATGNYWFIIVSTFLVTALVTLVTQRITEPRLASQPTAETSAPQVPTSHPSAMKWTLAAPPGHRWRARLAVHSWTGGDSGAHRWGVWRGVWTCQRPVSQCRRYHYRHGNHHGLHGRLPGADVLCRPVRGLVQL